MALDFIPDDFVDIGTFDVIGDEITVMAWVNPDAFPSDPRVIAKGTSPASADHFWVLLVVGGAPPNEIELRVFAGGSFASHTGTLGVPTGSWTHICAVYDGVDMRVFFNGVQDGGTTAKAGVIRVGAAPVWIGGMPTTPSDRPWDGDIDDARIYQRALSAEEILTIFTARGTDGIVDGLLSRYHLNEQPPGTVAPVTANFVKDVGPSKNDGDAVGGPIYSDSILRFRRKGF